MVNANANRRNRAPLLGFLLALAAISSNLLIFLRPPGERAIVWLGLALAAVAAIVVFVGIRRAFGENRGKIVSSVLGVFALLLCGFTVFAFVHAREVPASAGAPKVGQKAPDFTLTDSTGKQVSLAQLLAPANNPVTPGTSSAAPKAVLLIFYRGYW